MMIRRWNGNQLNQFMSGRGHFGTTSSRCFLAVAEELHFARAAERLHIEQSPLSRAIKELEEQLCVVLFARTTRSTRLTRAGKLFLGYCQQYVDFVR
ncbi:LysR family transcriptional regulator [Paenibacillus lautus]|uniref:LysR family transcriptional regulator n=1 Tax=Paenibacillus TaxID=44249 RepID=UPI00273E744E|nr:LysR family transcriptional regulator [Paenibacillus lautus]